MLQATRHATSLRRTQTGKDVLLSLPRRVNDLPMPPVVIVDVRHDPQIGRGHAIGRALKQGVERALNDGGQVILFLSDPEFRGWTMGTRRLLTNAILYGPGLGSSWSTPW